ncbi:MAG: cobalamin biosynthesis protein CobD [Rubellimicrobium sp.]|nr:cobalamin biosynthesis protein CobD [Rubellimicrobium sp.]
MGEPRILWDRWPHPAVLAGRWVAALDQAMNKGRDRRMKGVLAVLVLVSGAGVTGWILAALPGRWAELVVLAVLVAQRALVDHVRAVGDALRISVPSGRLMVARIVGRDTAAMDEAAVARAAVESAAENLSDGVVAPVFWYVLAGLPGLLVYKIVNTADSMIGHRTERHEAFGWAAARLDDVLNWIPARLTALLIWLVSPQLWSQAVWRLVRADARRHASPNAGWPEAVMARALNIALAGPRIYGGRVMDAPFVNQTARRDIGAAEVAQAVRVLWQVWAVLLVVAMLGTAF